MGRGGGVKVGTTRCSRNNRLSASSPPQSRPVPASGKTSGPEPKTAKHLDLTNGTERHPVLLGPYETPSPPVLPFSLQRLTEPGPEHLICPFTPRPPPLTLRPPLPGVAAAAASALVAATQRKRLSALSKHRLDHFFLGALPVFTTCHL